MTAPTTDLQNLVAATASRLRSLQTSLSDKDPQLRNECIREVLDSALAQMVPSQRKAFLQELLGFFPAWLATAQSAPAPAPPKAPSAQDNAQLRDPRFLASRLVEVAAGLSENDKKAVIGELRKAGLVAVTEVAAKGRPADVGDPAEIRSALGITADQGLDPERLVKLLSLLLAFQAGVGRVGWGTWKVMAPKSNAARQMDLRGMFGRFVSGDQSVTSKHAEQGLDQLLRLVTALVSSIGQLGRQISSQRLAAFSPDEIESIVKMERGSFLVAHEVRCWRKYSELAREALTEQALEDAIRDTLVEYAESLMKGFET
jgi:hypothetical protein